MKRILMLVLFLAACDKPLAKPSEQPGKASSQVKAYVSSLPPIAPDRSDCDDLDADLPPLSIETSGTHEVLESSAARLKAGEADAGRDYDRYRCGLMARRDMAIFENKVRRGEISGGKFVLNATPAAPVLPIAVVRAYGLGQLDRSEKLRLELSLDRGQRSWPPEAAR